MPVSHDRYITNIFSGINFHEYATSQARKERRPRKRISADTGQPNITCQNLGCYHAGSRRLTLNRLNDLDGLWKRIFQQLSAPIWCSIAFPPPTKPPLELN